jgi:hypothetical protein
MAMTTITKPKPHTLRRFGSLPTPSPTDVSELPATHNAIVGKMPLFPGQVFRADEVQNIFISGHNNRKIGAVVSKGIWTGMPIYMLTLPERTTCSDVCHMYKTCYGNAMHMAKRIAPGKALEARIAKDIEFLADKHPQGFVVRLHVLGDFYSVEYVQLWGQMLRQYEGLHIYGYTARGMTGAGVTDALIYQELTEIRKTFGDRFAMRWSRPQMSLPFPAAASVLDELPAKRPEGGVVCPAETESTACCSTCGLCWEPETRQKTIYFLKHGLGSSRTKRAITEINQDSEEGLRRIAAIEHLRSLARTPIGKPPQLLWVSPEEIEVETAYQRGLSPRSLQMIADIVANWDWAVFTPPCCVKIGDKIMAYDGQHTAIAAATHPEIHQIPILVTIAEQLEKRAMLFYEKQWGRLMPTQLQKFKALVAAKDPQHIEMQRVCTEAGVTVLAQPPGVGKFKVGETVAIGAIKRMITVYGGKATIDLLKVMIDGQQAPLRADVMKAVGRLLYAPEYRDMITPDAIAKALAGSIYEKVYAEAKGMQAEMHMPTEAAMAIAFYRLALKE